MGLLRYTQTLDLKPNPTLQPEILIERISTACRRWDVGTLELRGDTLYFRNLYMRRLDLFPVPRGWIRVQDKQDTLTISFGADYRWSVNRRGRLAVLLLVAGLLLVTAIQVRRYLEATLTLPSAMILAAIPILAAAFWFFVFSINSLYSRLFLARLIRDTLKL